MLRSPSRPTRRAVASGLAVAALFGSRAGTQPATVPPGRILRAAPLRHVLKPGAAEAELWAFDGRFEQPVLRVRQGEELRLRLVNDTPAPLSLHWQGARIPNGMDGAGGLTQPPVIPGAGFDYRFTPSEAGTFLIRPCVLGGSAEPLERGLVGALVVEESSPPPVDGDIVLLVDDWRLAEDGALAPFDPAADGTIGRLGNWLTVNGRPVPERIEALPGSRLRLRLLNAANARSMRLRFDGLKPFVVAVDGRPTETFEPLRANLPLAPGSRYDLIVDLPEEAGPAGSIVAMLGDGIPLVTLAAAGERASRSRPTLPPVAPLTPNRSLPAEIRLQSAVRRDVVLKGGIEAGKPVPDLKRIWSVNGAPGSASGKPLASVKRGQPVVLALVNQTALVQPMHLHGHAFRLLHGLDDGWEPYWLDTVQVPENRTLRIAFVADNPGRWLLASTVAERFDAGLWTWIEVV